MRRVFVRAPSCCRLTRRPRPDARAAILRYLCNSNHSLDACWYPVEPRARARVDAALDWQHSTLRRGASTLVFFRFFRNSKADAASDRTLKEALFFLQSALTQLDEYWLRDGYVAGSSMTVADLICACELSQLELLDACGVPPTQEQLLAPHAGVRRWLLRVAQETEPHFSDVHARLRAAAKSAKM